MIAYGMLYAAAVGLPIFLAAIACSAALRRYGRPERAVWLLGLGLALTFPVAFLTNPFGTSPGASGTLAETGLPAVASGTLPETGVLGLPAVVAVPVESGLGLDEILLLAWLLASVVLMLRWSIAAYRLKRVGAFWRAGTVDGVHVWLTSDLGPAVSGIIRTRILVPSWLVSLLQGQRSLVLLHEEEHVRARDPVLMAVSRIARIMAPWNPVVWLLSSRLLHAVELDCDRRVLGRRPDVETYGDTLLTVLARDSAPSNPKRPALRWSSRAGASPPFPPWRRIPMGKRRTVMVAVRVSPTEFADWRAKAAAAGVPLSALIRRAMARTRTWTAPAAEVERERTRQVSRIGNNLNQIARWANTHKGAAEAVEVIVHLVPIERALRALAPVGDPDPDAH